MSKPQNTYKHLVKFTSKQASRPALTGIRVDNDGTLTATDAHVLIRLPNHFAKGLEDGTIIDPKTLKVIQANYPATANLIPDESKAEVVMDISPKLADQIFNVLKGVAKDDLISFQVAKHTDVLSIEILDEISKVKQTALFKVSREKDNRAIDACFNPTFLRQVMDAVRDLTVSDCKLYFYSSDRPILLSQKGNFDILLTPVRKS